MQSVVFSNLVKKENIDIDSAIGRGDWSYIKEILQLQRDQIITFVQKSGLTGRGGAGFSTGLKWNFMPKNTDSGISYFIINADESEPGTFKDRYLMQFEPHKIIEGGIYSSFAIGASVCYIYIRGEYYQEYLILEKVLKEARDKGFIGKNILNSGFDLEIFIHRGSGAYICGEETALIESIEGNRGMPRIKPPFPANFGLFGRPTTINNVETVAYIPSIIKRALDCEGSCDNNVLTKVFCVSGCVNRPGAFEEKLGIGLREMIDTHCDGVIGGWQNLLGVIPGGSSVPILDAKSCENLKMDHESIKAAGSSLGTAGIIVFNKDVDLIGAFLSIAKFYAHESCGQCSPCREGTKWMLDLLERIYEGNGSMADIDCLLNLSYAIEGNTICALGDAASWPIQGFIKNFRYILEEHIRNGRYQSA